MTRDKQRDKFAAAALQALIAKSPFFDNRGEIGPLEPNNFKLQMSESAYAYADAMLAVKESN